MLVLPNATIEARIDELVTSGYRDVDARRIAEGEALTNATHAMGLDACACGRIAITYLWCGKLRFAAACCPLHRDTTLIAFRNANLRDHEWRADIMNEPYWARIREGSLAAHGEQAYAEPLAPRRPLDRCANCGAPRFACECGEFAEPTSVALAARAS